MDNNIEQIEHPKWHVINSFIDTWPFRDVFLPYLDEYVNQL